MQWRNRKVRIAIVVAIAVFAAFFAWRVNDGAGRKTSCAPGRHVEKDTGGKVVKITNTTCLE